MTDRIYSRKQAEVVLGLGTNPDKGGWDERWLIVDGPVRSGKTHSTIEGFLAWTYNHWGNHNFLVAARQFRLIKSNVRPHFFTAAQILGYPFKWHPGDSRMEIGTNNFWCVDAQTESAAAKIQGMTLAGAYLDEVALMPESFVIAVSERCSLAGAKIVGTCNPKEPSHWLKTKYIDRGLDVGCRNVSFSLLDNPTLDQEYIDNLIKTHTGTWRDRNLLGKWVAGSGMIWPTYTVEDYPSSDPTAWYVSVDAADRTVTHALLFGLWDDKLYVVDEWYYDAHQSGELAPEQKVAQYLDYFGTYRNITNWVVDRNAFAELATIRHFIGGLAVEALNTPSSRPQSIDQTYLWLHKGDCVISPQCYRLLASIQDFTHDKQSRNIRNDKKTDHGADALRNMIWWWVNTNTTIRLPELEWNTANAA